MYLGPLKCISFYMRYCSWHKRSSRHCYKMHFTCYMLGLRLELRQVKQNRWAAVLFLVVKLNCPGFFTLFIKVYQIEIEIKVRKVKEGTGMQRERKKKKRRSDFQFFLMQQNRKKKVTTSIFLLYISECFNHLD